MYGVVCYWKYVLTTFAKGWVFVESFPINEYNHCLITPSTGGGDREEWNKWLYKISTDENEELEPIMGRAVTIWTMEDGVSLLGIHPPGNFPKWLSCEFYAELRKSPNWFSLIKNGHVLYSNTATEAEKYLNFKKV